MYACLYVCVYVVTIKAKKYSKYYCNYEPPLRWSVLGFFSFYDLLTKCYNIQTIGDGY